MLPPPGPDLVPWLREEARPTPHRAPVLLVERRVEVTSEEASDLIEAALVGIDDVAPGDGTSKGWIVPLRPASGAQFGLYAHKLRCRCTANSFWQFAIIPGCYAIRQFETRTAYSWTRPQVCPLI